MSVPCERLGMTLDTVLLAVNEDDRTRTGPLGEIAVDIAGPAGAEVALAHVFTAEEYRQAKSALNYDADSEVTPSTVAKRYDTIRELGDVMDDHGVDFVWYGRLTDEKTESERIVGLAESIDADLIVVGGRKRSPTGKAVFGSRPQEIMLTAPCPVTFVRED